jgi:transcriptional regulator with XRE-family HTH domain
MATGGQLRAARRAADLTLADVAHLGGVSAGHPSRVELGEPEVTPATVVLYQRAIAQKTGTASSPTVDDVRRRDMFALAALPAVVPLAQPRQPDLDECAQWLAWETWQSGADALPVTDVPGDRKRAVAELVARRYLVRDRNARCASRRRGCSTSTWRSRSLTASLPGRARDWRSLKPRT